MPNDSLTDALKEVYSLASNEETVLNTLEISYTGLGQTLYLVQDRVSWNLTLEGLGGTQTFKPCGFRFIQPTAGAEGLQELSIAIDNVGTEVTDFFNALGTELTEPVKVTYRVYLPSDTSQPQYNPPLVLFLVDIQMTVFEVTGRATFSNIVNTKYPSDFYTAQRFPGLVGRGGNVIQPPSGSNAWDISQLSFSGSREVITGTDTPNDIYIKSDGTQAWTILEENKIQPYSFQIPWDITTIIATTQLDLTIFNVSPLSWSEIQSFGLFFKDDGTEFFTAALADTVVGGNPVLLNLFFSFTLSTAWDVSTASLNYFHSSIGDELPKCMFFRDDGSEFYQIAINAFTTQSFIERYSLTTPWLIPFGITPDIQLNINAQDNGMHGVFFRDNGEKLYTTGKQNDKLYEYDLSIAWDITTSTFSTDIDIGLSDPTAGVGPSGIFWKPDGLSAYIVVKTSTSNFIYQYDII